MGNNVKLPLLLSISALASIPAAAEELTIDASAPAAAPRTGHLNMGSNTSPNGDIIDVNSRYFTLNGEPWMPVMGEFHYTRFPPEEWDEQLAKIKAQGLDVVASYVIWNHHEARPAEFDWSGDRNLRAFVQKAAAHDLKVLIRIGPWAHGEVRFGGTPDWVVNAMPTRRNDAVYLQYVERWWRQLYQQVQGQFWKDGGPIIGVQLENEYNLDGPGMGAEHISTLKTLARGIGFDAPLYTVTGWDSAIYPRGEVLPVFAGYPDEPWGATANRLPPKEVYAFRFDSRVAGNVGAQTTSRRAGTIASDMDDTPFLGAEYGGGVPIMYRRRPLIAPDDIAAMLPVQLGSGANLYGYYMFHGGRNPQSHTTLEEDDRLGGYNGMPIVNYDFQAPLGQYGQEQPVADAIRPYHHFINSFGALLAPMQVNRPPQEPTTRDDVSTPRWSVRSQGDRGFLFFNNHVRQYETPIQAGTRFTVRLPSGPLSFPSQPVDIPSGAHFIWPINMDLDGVTLSWATAQPVTRLEDGAGAVYVFSAVEGIPVELALRGAGNIRGGRGAGPSGEGAVIRNVRPGFGEALSFTTPSGKSVRIIVLEEEQAQQLYLFDIAGQRRLVHTEDPAFMEGGTLRVRSRDDADFRVSVFPTLDAAPQANLRLARTRNGMFQTWTSRAPARNLDVEVKPLRPAGQMPVPEIGGRANAGLQPYPETYGRSAAWTIDLPPNTLDDLSEAWLRIDYSGDVARLLDGVDLLDDQFFYGRPWEIGLSRFGDRLARPWTLTVLPLRADAPIYIQEEIKPRITDGQVAAIGKVSIIPEYELRLAVQP
ncbi:beta-galactosidase [Croceibacterium sp. TMG7-5b_MA50]|uniref:beta-galactosidase n=1 Tax=Croceibacterium sp. TMG7-5b_MA50 TaxID=3121290 RepID=UPI003221D979